MLLYKTLYVPKASFSSGPKCYGGGYRPTLQLPDLGTLGHPWWGLQRTFRCTHICLCRWEHDLYSRRADTQWYQVSNTGPWLADYQSRDLNSESWLVVLPTKIKPFSPDDDGPLWVCATVIRDVSFYNKLSSVLWCDVSSLLISFVIHSVWRHRPDLTVLYRMKRGSGVDRQVIFRFLFLSSKVPFGFLWNYSNLISISGFRI